MLPQNNSKPSFWHSYWGLFTTLSIGLLIFLVFSLLQSLFLISYGFYLENTDTTVSFENIIKTLAYNGDAISFSEIPAAAIGIFLVIQFTRFRKQDTVKNFLELSIPPLKTILMWLTIMLLVIVLLEFSYILFDRNTPDFMTKVYSSTKNIPLLWLAVIIVAPLFEEFLFRGFLLEGISQTKVGINGAIVLTSASWAVIHLQYESFEIITIFLIGIILGIAKYKSRSLLTPIAMHMLMNLSASIMMEIS